MKNHLKRISAPRTWHINRKERVFILRPNPGAHPLSNGVPIGVLLRDMLKLGDTMREIKKLLNRNEILVDGKRRKDHRFIVGLFDVVSVPMIKKEYRVVLDGKGRVAVVEIQKEEAATKVCKIIGKTVLTGGKMQFHLHDGKNIVSDHQAKVGDSFVLSLPDGSIKQTLPLQKGMQVFLTQGKHKGDLGVLQEVAVNEAVYKADGKLISTAKKYPFVVGEKQPVIKVRI